MAFLPTSEHCNQRHDDRSDLQKHASFFDRNHDGVIYPWETFQGLRAIGCNTPVAIGCTLFINLGASWKSLSKKIPNLRFPIEVKNIRNVIHGSDTGAYDSEGRFVPSKFEEIFKKHARTYPNALTSKEVTEMRRANKDPLDITGWVASLFEWQLLYGIAKDENGLLQKETVRAVYDGSLFEHLEKERGKKKA